MIDVEPIIEAFENLLEAITPGTTPPPAPTPSGADTWDPACQYRKIKEFKTSAAGTATETLTRLYSPAAAWWDEGGIQIGAYEDPTPTVAGKTRRSSTPGFEFDIGINRNRLVQSYFDAAITLVHELAHVNHARTLGFLPYDVITLVSKKEYVALSWEFEWVAFNAMLDGAKAIFTSDKDKYRPCFQTSIGLDQVLMKLNANKTAQARQEIKTTYAQADAESDWTAHHTGPAPSTDVVDHWTVHVIFNDIDTLVSSWGL